MSPSPFESQHAPTRRASPVVSVAQTLLGMAGVLLARSGLRRTAAELAIVVVSTALLVFGLGMRPEFAIALFGVSFAVRHAFLFMSFWPGGIAPLLQSRLGSERGFAVHEGLTAFLLFAQRVGFVGLLLATSNSNWDLAWYAAGAVLVPVGLSMSAWATHVAGLDTYYYRDLFMGPRHVNLQLAGPYGLFSNPVYGVGQLAAYGIALMAGSAEGVIAAALNQLALYLFYLVVEKPHLRSSTRISIDTEVQETLARSTLVFGIVPAPLGGLVRSRPPPRRRNSVA